MVKRDSLFRKAKKSKDPIKWSEAKEFRNLVNDTCKKAKGEYIKNKLIELEGEHRKFWQTLKPLYCNDEKQNNEIVKLEGCIGAKEVAEAFNNFFLNIGVNFRSKIKILDMDENTKLENHCNKPEMDDTRNTQVENRPRFKFRKTSTLEMDYLVKNIKIHKASGVEGISSYLLKLCLQTPLIN